MALVYAIKASRVITTMLPIINKTRKIMEADADMRYGRCENNSWKETRANITLPAKTALTCLQLAPKTTNMTGCSLNTSSRV